MPTVTVQAQPQDIKIYRGDTPTIRCTIKSYSTGQALNLTDYTAIMTVKRQPYDDDVDALFQLTGTIASPTTGIATFSPTNAQTTKFVGEYYYDIQIYKSGPDVKTVIAGRFIIGWDVTRKIS
jgi:hypothetical protein